MPETPCPKKARPAIRVAVADDHAVIREGLRAWLSLQPEFVFVGEAETGKDAISLLRNLSADVLLLDLAMPGQSGLDALPMIRAKAPRVSVLVFSGYPEDVFGVRAMRMGASGFISKSCELVELAQAIRRLAQGGRHLSRELAGRLVNRVRTDELALHDHLTGREFQILLKLSSGSTLSSIADELHITAKTVTMYRARIAKKLGLVTNGDLTYYAIKHDLVL